MNTSFKPRHWILIIIAFCAVVLVVVGAKPIYHQVKIVRAQSLAKKANDSIAKGDLETAESQLLSAIYLARNDPKVMRARGNYLNLKRHPISQDIWTKLVKTEPTVSENWAGLFNSSLAIEDKPMAILALTGYQKAAPENNFQIKQMQFQLFEASGNREGAITLAKTILKDPQMTDRFRIQIYRIFLSSNEKDRNSAHDWLKQKIDAQDEQSLSALITLSKDSKLPEKTQLWIADKLYTHPDSTVMERVLSVSIRVANQPDPMLKIKHWKKLSEQRSLTDRIKIARWLMIQKNAAAAGLMLTHNESFENRDAALVMLDILGVQKKWAEMDLILNEKDFPIPESLQQLYKARSAYEQGNLELFELKWRRAVVLAKNNSKNLGYLANYASSLEWYENAREVCEIMTENISSANAGWFGLYNLARTTGNKSLMKEAIGHMDVL